MRGLIIRASVAFAVGALSGLAAAVYFGIGKHSEPKAEQVADCPPVPAIVVAAKPEAPLEAPTPFPPNDPAIVGGKSSPKDEELRAKALRDQEDLRAREQQAEELPAQPPPGPDSATVPPPPAIEGPAPQPVAPVTPPPPVVAAPEPSLLIPVEGIKAKQLRDTFSDSRGHGRVHDAIDIMAPRGTPVLATADGKVAKLFHSEAGGLTIYEFDSDGKFAFYYAHLSGYAKGIVEGRLLKRGDLIGYVGSTGNASADAPHLHFAIFVLGPKKRWWEGTAINPYPILKGQKQLER